MATAPSTTPSAMNSAEVAQVRAVLATASCKMEAMREAFLQTSQQTTEMYEKVFVSVNAKLLVAQLELRQYRAATKLQTSWRARTTRRHLAQLRGAYGRGFKAGALMQGDVYRDILAGAHRERERLLAELKATVPRVQPGDATGSTSTSDDYDWCELD